MIYPKAFEFDYRLRKAFISACDALYIYGMPREIWCTKLGKKLDKPTANFVWEEAKRLLFIK